MNESAQRVDEQRPDSGPSAVRPTRPRPDGGLAARDRTGTTDFAALLAEVRDAGLLAKRPRYYLTLALVLSAIGAVAVVALVTLGPTPWQLLDAAVLGVVFAQFGFLAHEAAHRQVFESGPANDRLARLLGPAVVGIGYTWWQQDHNRHHANPNIVARDPSVEAGAFVFRAEDARGRKGPARAFLRVQGYLLPPLLLFAGVRLHVQSLHALLTARGSRQQRWELVLVVARLAVLPLLVFSVLPFGLACGFLAVQLGTFGLCLGGAFVPNHVGMPVLPTRHGYDYLRKQAITSRNLTGGALMSTLTGGLSLQIEHHLFPGMARPNLLAARPLVRARCEALGIPYTEVSLTAAFARVIKHLNDVGVGRGAEFRCPVVDECGRA